jgi:4-hydroxy-tetrahydrodipicolinate reductase
MFIPLKLALIGYGKMGQLIEQLAIVKGHTIVAKIHSKSAESDWAHLQSADVAIEFTQPEAVLHNIKKCFSFNVPVVVGTTGWYNHLDEVIEWQKQSNAGLLTASNFSIGVNVFFKLNQLLA